MGRLYRVVGMSAECNKRAGDYETDFAGIGGTLRHLSSKVHVQKGMIFPDGIFTSQRQGDDNLLYGAEYVLSVHGCSTQRMNSGTQTLGESSWGTPLMS